MKTIFLVTFCYVSWLVVFSILDLTIKLVLQEKNAFQRCGMLLNKRFKILHKQRRKKCSPPYYIGKIKQNIIFYNTNYLNCTNSTILRKTSDIFYRLGSFKPSVQSLSHEKWHFQMASNDFSNSWVFEERTRKCIELLFSAFLTIWAFQNSQK